MEALYVATATSHGGRSGRAETPGGELDLAIAVPKELGGDGEGTNPEQLFAAGYACCFLNALILTAAKREIDPSGATVSADVGLVTVSGGIGLAVELRVRFPGIERELAEKLVERAHRVCPFSNATRGNVDLALTIEEPAASAA
jgi:lipoyl-dependent peroxiredoxin